MTHVVVVEDEPAIRRGVVDVLRLTGYGVTEAADGDAGLTAALRRDVGLVLLDLLLPKRDGLDVLAELRKVRPALPVIVLTARGTEDDRVRGLRMGADDYVVKPFSARELLARVEAVLRRSPHAAPQTTGATLGPAKLDFQRREVVWPCGTRIELSETEANILTYLLAKRETTVARDDLLAAVWGVSPQGVETRAVDMHVARLRAKLRDPSGADAPEAILTVRGRGYAAGPELVPLENSK
ncbi:MAG: response regulator transcription factor [Gemmataceae bacterium]